MEGGGRLVLTILTCSCERLCDNLYDDQGTAVIMNGLVIYDLFSNVPTLSTFSTREQRRTKRKPKTFDTNYFPGLFSALNSLN